MFVESSRLGVWGIGLAEDNAAATAPSRSRGTNLLSFALREVREGSDHTEENTIEPSRRRYPRVRASHTASGGDADQSLTSTLRMALADGSRAGKRSGYTALMYAANLGREESVRVLLAHGADPNATDNQRSTPLMFAAQHGCDGIVSQLLSAGASPDARGDHGLTPLDVARRHHHESTTSLLLGAGAGDTDASSTE